MIDTLITYFEQHIELEESEREFLRKNIPIKTFDKNELLLTAGETSQAFYHIFDGCIRLYYMNGIEEKTAFFYFENMFVSSYESFIRQAPAKHSLQTIERTTVAEISVELAYQLLKISPKFEFLARVMMEEELIVCQEIISSFVTLNAEQRYLKLLETNAPLLQRIPQYHLATYLGVTPETLSRIRKRVFSR